MGFKTVICREFKANMMGLLLGFYLPLGVIGGVLYLIHYITNS